MREKSLFQKSESDSHIYLEWRLKLKKAEIVMLRVTEPFRSVLFVRIVLFARWV